MRDTIMLACSILSVVLLVVTLVGIARDFKPVQMWAKWVRGFLIAILFWAGVFGLARTPDGWPCGFWPVVGAKSYHIRSDFDPYNQNGAVK